MRSPAVRRARGRQALASARAGPGARVPWRRWALLCAAAEAVGMTAAAGAATAANVLSAEPARSARLVAWGLVVVGGLVEGVALGFAQSAALRTTVHRLDRGRWILTTVLVAGLGWGVVSAQAATAGDDGGTQPGWPVVLVGAAGLGLAMGTVLGAAQGWALRGAVRRPSRWVLVSAVAWTPAMVVIFAGATATPASWPVAGVLVLGATTGALAGAVLGALCATLLAVRGLDDREASRDVAA